jgi:hypothetical protein
MQKFIFAGRVETVRSFVDWAVCQPVQEAARR